MIEQLSVAISTAGPAVVELGPGAAALLVALDNRRRLQALTEPSDA